MVIDIVTTRKQSLHLQLLRTLGTSLDAEGDNLYAAAYRVAAEASPQLEVWYEVLELGRSLPTLPLWLKPGVGFPVDLEKTYNRTCQAQRIEV